MKNEVNTILFEYLAGEGDILNEEAVMIQETEKQFYESLMIGGDLVLADGNKLINGKRKKLWGVLKKRGYEELPRGIQVDLRWSRYEEQIIIRIILQCRYGTGTKKRYPSDEDLIRHSRLLSIPYLNEDGFHYKSQSGIEAPDTLKTQVEHDPSKNIELVFTHSMNFHEEIQKKS